jgi:hypothetical protein
MNAIDHSFTPRTLPSWINAPHCKVPVTTCLMLGTVSVLPDIEATVTVYREEGGTWGVGEIEIHGWRGNYAAAITVEQDGSKTETLSGFLADAVYRELDDPITADRAEELLCEAERQWGRA